MVIAIIAVLAALLLPALSSAKKRAQRTTCLNNLQQLNLGARMYADDLHDAPPSPGTAAAGDDSASRSANGWFHAGRRVRRAGCPGQPETSRCHHAPVSGCR